MSLSESSCDSIADLAMKGHYPPMAYVFVHEAVNLAIKDLEKSTSSSESSKLHDIPGNKLVQFIKELLLQRFGPFAIDVLDFWNIKETRDFGEIVFQLSSINLLGVSEKDSIEDFDHVFDFTDAFVLPFK